jgi:hypothetical protein
VPVVTIPEAETEALGMAFAVLSFPRLSLIFKVGPFAEPAVQVTIGVIKETAVATPEELI